MIVSKIRGQDKFGKVILSQTEVAMVRKMGISLEAYVRAQLDEIAKARRWKWYFTKEKNT